MYGYVTNIYVHIYILERKTTVWIFQATNGRYFTREDQEMAKKGKLSMKSLWVV